VPTLTFGCSTAFSSLGMTGGAPCTAM
jgi:hypothetical protein